MKLTIFSAFIVTLLTATVFAETPFDSLKEDLTASERELLNEALSGYAFPYPGLERKITNQPEFTFKFDAYLNRLASDERAAKGRNLLEKHSAKLAKTEAKYGVPKEVIVALWGVESYFGKLPGKYPIVPVLATHVYNDYRADFFGRELKAALKILKDGHVTTDNFTGSWAGAMGQCQFMPSSFINYAADGDGDGKADIWQTEADVFASAANYLKRHGWQTDAAWKQPVYLSKILPQIYLSERGMSHIKTVAEWQEIGIKPKRGSLPPGDTPARLYIPYGPSGQAQLVFNNFDVILKWNRSSAFAFSVLTLADKIAQ